MQNVDSDQFLKQATRLFGEINKKINLLIDCSAQDFDILNQGFKQYHQIIQDLTSHTDQVLNTIVRLSEDLGNQKNALENSLPLLEKGINSSNTSQRNISIIIKEISYLFVHVNNLKQNISTLRLITTNMKFEPRYYEVYDEIIAFIDKLMTCSGQFDQELQKIDAKLKNCLDIYSKICIQQYPKVFKAYKRLVADFNTLLSNDKTYQQLDKTMKNLSSQKTMSSANIVTNLQFQDIIRQKIEHVQEAQEKLMSRLDGFSPNSTSSSSQRIENKSLHIIFQTRNIALLQAAQLVHANTEYQKAIDTITQGFEELDLIVLEAKKALQDLYQDPIFSSSINACYTLFKEEYEKLQVLNQQLQHVYTEIFREDNLLISASNDLNCAIDNCKTLVGKLNEYKSKYGLEKSQVNPFNQLLANFKKFLTNSSETNKSISKTQNRISKEIIPGLEDYFNTTLKLDKTQKKYSIDADKLIEATNNSIDQSDLFKTNDALHSSEFDSNKLQYFKVFEKEIDQITNQIDNLCNQIDFKTLEKEYDLKDLKQIHELYTMESEREVHAMITGEEYNNNESVDEIELF